MRQEHDIHTARNFYMDLMLLEQRMGAVGDLMPNRGHWIEALGHLREARESLQMFIGERMTADLRDAYEVYQESERIRQERQRAPDPEGEGDNGTDDA